MTYTYALVILFQSFRPMTLVVMTFLLRRLVSNQTV